MKVNIIYSALLTAFVLLGSCSGESSNKSEKNKVVKIIDLIDNTDNCGDEFESQEDFEFDSDEWHEERAEYIEAEEENQQEFFKDAKHFVYNVLKKHLGNFEADKYSINL